MFLSGNSSCVETLGERLQRYHALNHMCEWFVQTMGKTSWAGDVMTRRLKSTCGATGISFLSFSKALCVCVSHDLCSVSLIYCFLSCYKSSNIESSCISKPKQRQRSIRVKADHVTDCVFLPAHTTANERGYTQFVRDLIGSEACRVGSRGGFHCVCFATGKLSFLVVPAPLPPSRSGGCVCGNRRWIRWREWRRASPYLLSVPTDLAPALWDWKPAPRFFPPEKGLDAPPVFFRGGGRGGCRWAFAKRNVCTSILWMNIKQNKVIKKNITGERSSHTQALEKKRRGWSCFPLCNTLCSHRARSEECVCAYDLAVRSGPVLLLLRHCGDWDNGDRTWIWWTG